MDKKSKESINLVQSAEDIDLSLQKIFCGEINTLCEPIFKLFNVNYFSHTRAIHNGSFISLMTKPELTELFLKRKYPISFSTGKGFYLNDGCYFSDAIKQDFGSKEKLKTLYDEFHIGCMITIIKNGIDYDDMYSFGLKVGDECLINKFSNNLNMIEHFIQYFKWKSLSILRKMKPVSYGEDYFAPSSNNLDPGWITRKEQEIFFKNLPLKKVQVSGNLGDVLLSQREYECLRYASKCYSLKEIAKQINVSPRTVETYLNNVKNKLGIEKRSDLVLFDL